MAQRRGSRGASVVLRVDPVDLRRCLTSLADTHRAGHDAGLVLLGLGHTSAPDATGTAPGARLLTTAWDHRGWWELDGCVVHPDGPDAAPAIVVRSVEIDEALADPETATVVELSWSSKGLELAGATIDAVPGVTIPAPPDCSAPIDRLGLTGPDGEVPSSIVETRIGRLRFAPVLSDHLAARGIDGADLVTVDGAPHVVARPPVDAGATGPVIVAPLELLGVVEPLPPDVLERRRLGSDDARALLVAQDPDTDPDELISLLDESIGQIRQQAAAHPRLPRRVMEEILRAGTESMRASVASNPNLPGDLAAVAAVDPSRAVRAAIAANPGAPSEVRAVAAGSQP